MFRILLSKFYLDSDAFIPSLRCILRETTSQLFLFANKQNSKIRQVNFKELQISHRMQKFAIRENYSLHDFFFFVGN